MPVSVRCPPRGAGYAYPTSGHLAGGNAKLALALRSVGYARPPLGVPADLQSAVKKCPNLFMLWGFAIPSNQAVAGISMG